MKRREEDTTRARIEQLRRELHTECYYYLDGFSECINERRALEIHREIDELLRGGETQLALFAEVGR